MAGLTPSGDRTLLLVSASTRLVTTFTSGAGTGEPARPDDSRPAGDGRPPDRRARRRRQRPMRGVPRRRSAWTPLVAVHAAAGRRGGGEARAGAHALSFASARPRASWSRCRTCRLAAANVPTRGGKGGDSRGGQREPRAARAAATHCPA